MSAMRSQESTVPRFNLMISEQEVVRYLLSIFDMEVAKTGKRLQRTAALTNAIQAAAHWIVAPERVGLKIMGKPGTGKSTLVMSMKRLIEEYWVITNQRDVPGLLIKPALLIADSCLRGDTTMSITELVSRPALAIDDMGLEPTTIKYYGSELMPIRDIVHERINQNRITIVATNLNETEIRNKYGARLCDRLRDMTTIILDGESHRCNTTIK